MACAEMVALQTVQGEACTHHIRCETHQDDLTGEAITPDPADCQGLLPTRTQDSLQDTGKGI